MKRITIMAALLGSFHFASAQVGIGTPSPANSSQLDIVANNKGVLIPRIALTSTAVFAPVEGTEVESLLVYNTATAGDVTPGFYYWFNNKWERIVNQTQLEEAISDITDLQGDVDKIIALLKVAFPSNNLVNPVVTGDTQGGGMVFTPGTTPTIEYVYFDGTDYVKKDITDDIIDIIKGAESKTKIVTIDNVQYYVSESYTGTTDPTLGTEPGVYKIDIVGGVINNIEEIFTTTTTIVINEGATNEQTFNTVEEYIQYISENAMQEGVTKIVIDAGTSQASFETWNGTTWVSVANTVFSDIVKLNQSLTDIATTNVSNVIQYVYTAEPAVNGTARTFTLNLTQDLITLIENNTDVQNAITNLTYDGVYYNGTGTDLTVGTTVIPEGALYTIDDNGNGVIVDISDTIISEVVNNFNEIINSEVVVNGDTYQTVEEYIQHISSQADGNVIYKNIATAGDPDEWVFQYWDATANGGNGDYVTINLTDLVGAAQSQTTIVTYQGSQYYLSETYVLAGGEMDPANWTAVPAGAILIDAVEGVVNNFNEFINSTVTGGGSNYTTVEEYIQYISENAMQAGVTRIVLTGGQASFERWNDTTNSWTPVNNSAFETIVQANETETVIGKSTDNSAYAQVSTDPKATDKIVYEYLAENATNYMDITGDVAWSIENNTDVQNAIEDIVNNLLNQGGNVYFTRTNIAAGTPAGQLAIPAFSFYTINSTTGVKEIVDITDIVVNAITNANPTQITTIKNALGDKIVNNTSVITGNTYNSKTVRKGIFTTTIAANTAITSGITLDEAASEIISITVKYGSGLIANVTDLEIDATGNDVSFNIGTGNMYQVLGSTDIDAEVIIEFAEL